MRPRPLADPVLLVAHDAGGAEVVSSWARRSGRKDLRAIVDGPASRVFAGKLPRLAALPPRDLDAAVRNAASVLTGTSWESDLERRAIRAARAARVPVSSFVDHWVNYERRFGPDLPDEIWVGDDEALAIARRCFPPERVRLEPNPYFEDVRAELAGIAAPAAGGALRVLYVTEPISAHAAADPGQHPGYDEFQALDYFLGRLAARPGAVVRLRPHPAEPRDKYRERMARHPETRMELSTGTTLLEDCAWAQWVVGCESMAMVIGLLAGREVYSAIPPGGRPCALPQREIRRL